MQCTTLYYREGSSDKVYRVAHEEVPGGWVVTFAFGRRGSTLTSGTKTQSPIGYADAVKIYDKLVSDKIAKGYTSGAESMAYTDGSRRVTNIRPQLLNPVEGAELAWLLADNAFILQPKLDGKRLLIQKRGNDVVGINRRGIECGIPESIRNAALALDGNFLIDGEAVGDELIAFDLLERDGVDFRARSYRCRRRELRKLLGAEFSNHIRRVCTFEGEEEKCDAFNRYRQQQVEGVVFKKDDAPYNAGRPASGGDQLKLKFVETATVVISAINGKRSAAISLWKDANLVSAGNVTIPPNHPIPEIGQVAEVRYLYAMPDSGSLFQPVYLGVRDDIEPAECVTNQLKYKKAA